MENDLWEKGADWWQRSFTEGADPEYEEQILPLVEQYARGARRVLDIGCGEGQVGRRLADQGAEVVGLDPTESQIRKAAIEEVSPATYEHSPTSSRVETPSSTRLCCVWRSNTSNLLRLPFKRSHECFCRGVDSCTSGPSTTAVARKWLGGGCRF